MLIILLPRLSQFYRTDRFTVDLDSGEVFAYTGEGWHPAGLRCQHYPFNLNILGGTIVQASQRFRDEISSTEQTRIVALTNRQDNWAKPPDLPPLGEAELYISYQDVMQLETRKRYVKDRTQAGITYIVEHSHTLTLKGENRYHSGMLDTRLNIIFGRVQAIKEKVDEALRLDDMHRRRRNMRTLEAPARFPDPSSMNRTSNDEWLRWMRQEMFALVDAIDEEHTARQDENDPFNGTAGGIFQPLPGNSRTEPAQTEGNRGNSLPQEGNAQNGTPERVVPVQTIRPTPQTQREMRRNTTGNRQPQPLQGQKGTPAIPQVQEGPATHVQTPLIHPTETVERTATATRQLPRSRGDVDDEISSQDGIHRINDSSGPGPIVRERPAQRERGSNNYQGGYRQ